MARLPPSHDYVGGGLKVGSIKMLSQEFYLLAISFIVIIVWLDFPSPPHSFLPVSPKYGHVQYWEWEPRACCLLGNGSIAGPCSMSLTRDCK